MGQNLILNMNGHGFVVCAYNRTTEKVDQFLANEAKGTKVIGAHSLEEMVQKLRRPKRVMMLVKGECVFSLRQFKRMSLIHIVYEQRLMCRNGLFLVNATSLLFLNNAMKLSQS